MPEEVVISKLVHGGQGLGVLKDGKKIFVWNALPGETVVVTPGKSRKSYAEGVAETIIKRSPERMEPQDEAYLSTSPWQIMTFAAENHHKQEILTEAIAREHVEYGKTIPFHAGKELWHYRNKMEYSFWADDDGLHLALFNRASHGKRIIPGSSIARPEIDEVAQKIVAVLNKHGIRGSQLKTVVVRVNTKGETVAALFVKDEHFPRLEELANISKGLVVYFSNPKSPASVLTRELYQYADITLTDNVLGQPITYDVNSFFQVNLPIFEQAALRIAESVKGAGAIVDMYSGVGTLAIPTGATRIVESDPRNIEMAKQNATGRHIEIVHATAETALDYVPVQGTLIVDPPRAGLHVKVIERILEAKPAIIAYLSCNPSTQARDLALLQNDYQLDSLEGYNFFPRTPHIESLAILTKKP